MNVFTTPSRIVVTCNKRLAPYLESEIRELGFKPTRVFATGVELRGTVNDCIRLNLQLRCASQVHYSLKEFTADNPEHVYRNIHSFPWEKLLDEKGYFSVTSNVDHPTVNNSLFINVKVKDAVVDRMRKQTGERPDSGPLADRVVIHLYWRDNKAELFLDTSGETLAKHGYRKIPGKAPMLEALAAATIMATRWDRRSAFVNPMCGSSTLAIEALLLATNRRPGLYRSNYSFMHVKGFDEAFYANEYRRMEDQVKEVPGLQVIATDISEDAIHVSRVNAGIAGVEKMISFRVCDFELTDVPEGGGVVYFNPEYGERLGEVTALEATYARVGDFLKKKCKGYTGYIFTGNLDLAKKIGLRASRRIEFYTAKLDCRLLEYELYEGSKRSKEPVVRSKEGDV
ncbi:class I SAM-dependent RNA methyltransferase [Fulvivirgaceae bacterium PWU4]|uniref:Class I SAM-dependent RNA methyltransferase n=1 Tax=Chryseosolibacter histidini TaxID=2782349 RepID=A0AAP2DKT3_9BACT|nr:class I SAM-dependent RNA methyltransferase [Chryseosolibacter histidini]MBT1698175.1 class I SAM-dependent RNA methyltransferase [Chryseosolibacter histidini]